MSVELYAREELRERSLAHYRVGGEKKGVRKYQYEDGSLTPLGRIHYGVGKFREAAKDEVGDHVKAATSLNNADKNKAKSELYEHRSERAKTKAVESRKAGDDETAEKYEKKAAKFDKLAESYLEKQKHLLEKDARNERSTAEIRKDVENRIKDFNEKTSKAKEERKQKVKEEKARLKSEQDEIRSLTDEDLDKRIQRLQKEKQYSELLNERANREKGPMQAFASKLFKDAAEKLARKSLDIATDELLKKYRNRISGNKDQNGNNNQSGNKDKNGNNNQSGNKNDSGGGGGKFSKAEKNQIRTMAGSGKSVADIAKALGVTEDKVKGFMKSANITIS